MRSKRFWALSLASVLALSSTFAVFADATPTDATSTTADMNGNLGTGDGTLEGYANNTVYLVNLPTTKEIGFRIDPQALMYKVLGNDVRDNWAVTATDGTTPLTGEDYSGYLLFGDATPGDATNELSTVSDKLTFVNKSAFGVNVSIDVKVSGLTDSAKSYDIKVLDPAKAASSTDATYITMAVNSTVVPYTGGVTPVDASKTTATPVDVAADGTASVKTELTAANADAFVVTVTNATAVDAKYVYQHVDNAKMETLPFEAVEYTITGTVNTNTDADWSNWAKASAPLKLDITYNIAKAGSGYVNKDTITSADKTFAVTLPDGVTVSKIVGTYKPGQGTGTKVWVMGTSGHYTKTKSGNVETYKLTNAGYASYASIEIQYSNNVKEVVQIQ